MRLHILETVNDSYVLDPTIHDLDIIYNESEGSITKWRWTRINFVKTGRLSLTNSFRITFIGDEIGKWLTEQGINQDPHNWSESDHLLFQLRFG